MKVKKPVRAKKASNGVKQQPKPKVTYKNLQMAVNANDSEGLGYTKTGRVPSKEDSALYRFGFERGLKGEKAYPGEPNVQRLGRWEGQNANKPATVKKKAKGGAIKKAQNSLPKDSLRAKMKTEYGPRKLAIDTAGYSAGKKGFPGTVTMPSGKTFPKTIGRKTVNTIVGAPRQRRFPKKGK